MRFTTHVQTGLATLSQLQVAWILTSDWIKLWKSQIGHIIHRSYVTCRNFVEKIRTTVNYSLLSATRQQSFVACKHPDFFFFARQIWTWVVKRATSLFKVVCQQWCETSCTFLLPLLNKDYFCKENSSSLHALRTIHRIFPSKIMCREDSGNEDPILCSGGHNQGKNILHFEILWSRECD